IHKHLRRFLRRLPTTRLNHGSTRLKARGDIDVANIDKTLAKLRIDRSVTRSSRFTGGQNAASSLLRKFVNKRLAKYADDRNEPAAEATSMMSPYLHFGQISPIEIALAADDEVYREELIVRRELAVNFVYFNSKYDAYDGLPNWAKRTLKQH